MKRPCSLLRIVNIKKLRSMKLTYRQIGKIFGVSSTQIQYWLNGRKVEYLRKRLKRCEICGRSKVLNHHHWDNPRIGLWLCPRCHWAAEVLEEMPDFVLTYFKLKDTAQLLAPSDKVGANGSPKAVQSSIN